MKREAEVQEYLATWLHGNLNPKEVNVITKRSPWTAIFFMIYFSKTGSRWGGGDCSSASAARHHTNRSIHIFPRNFSSNIVTIVITAYW